MVGRSSDWNEVGLRVVRVRDGVDVLVVVQERSDDAFEGRVTLDLFQPDWR